MHSSLAPGDLLPRSFYSISALEAAPLLLGQILERDTGEGVIRCRIVETESYGGVEDKGSHAYGGRRTARTEVMFGEGGAAYVYLIYGMYHCLNVVTGPQDDPQAVLIRAVEPLTLEDEVLMRRCRGSLVRRPSDLSGGPGKLCRALGIDKALNGALFYSGASPLRLAAGGRRAGGSESGERIVAAPRINIPYAEEYAAKPWRFYFQDNPYVSRVDQKSTAHAQPFEQVLRRVDIQTSTGSFEGE